MGIGHYVIFGIAAVLGVSKQSNLGSARFGTLILSALTSDGIVIAADSRQVLIQDMKPISYSDSCQKIYTLKGGHPFAFTGNSKFNDEMYLYELVANFGKTQLSDGVNRYETLKTFVSLPVFARPTPENKKNALYSGFYRESQPYLFQFANGKIDTIHGFYISDAGAAETFFQFLPKKDIEYRLARSTSRSIAETFDTIIKSFSRVRKDVGGPVSIIIIKPDNTFTFFKNDFSKTPLGQRNPVLITSKDSALWDSYLRNYMQ